MESLKTLLVLGKKEDVDIIADNNTTEIDDPIYTVELFFDVCFHVSFPLREVL